MSGAAPKGLLEQVFGGAILLAAGLQQERHESVAPDATVNHQTMMPPMIVTSPCGLFVA